MMVGYGIWLRGYSSIEGVLAIRRVFSLVGHDNNNKKWV